MSLNLDEIVLASGAHAPDSGEGCAMEWVSVLAGEDWSDSPRCTSPVIAAFVRAWNDLLPDDERQQLKRYIPRLVDSRGTAEQEERRAWMAADWLVRVHAPAWLRFAGLTEQAALLEGLPEVTAVTVPSIQAPLKAVRQATDAAWVAASASTGAAAGVAARVAASASTGAAARDAAWAAARDAAWATGVAADAARVAAGATGVAGDAAMVAAWAAADAAWITARDDAAVAARAAARAALDPTKRDLQAKAHDLLDRMITVTEETPDA